MRHAARTFLLSLPTAILLSASPAVAQSMSLTGSVSALVDHLPNVPAPRAAGGRDAVTELRMRAMADTRVDAKPWLRFRFAGFADGVVADRGGAIRSARADTLEAWGEVSGARGDLRVGMSRIVWGRLDEVQPTDVINPIDVARFLLEGRSEARIAVPLVRARVFATDTVTLEGVLVPVFRPGTFDGLDEATSPFNLLRDLPPPACPPGIPCGGDWLFIHDEPDAGRLQGGARLSVTTGRVDWSVSGWRGFVPFALVGGVSQEDPATLRLVHPRYTMLGADVETVAGRWAWRAEAAYFPHRPLQVENQPATFEGNSFEGGAGVDRRAGDFTLSGTILLRRVSAPAAITNVSVVAGFSRTYDRDRIATRLFALINPEDKAGFLRGLLAWKPADDVALETSVGWFVGEGDDVITRFGDRDFGYIRLKYYFGR